MYEYRLTRRGRITVALFITLLFFITGALSMEIIAGAQDKQVDNPHMDTFVGSDDSVNKGVSEEKPDASYAISTTDMDNINTGNGYEPYITDKIKDESHPYTDNRNADILYVQAENAYEYEGKKIAFLTFDDGPSKNITPQILNILDKYNVKATFFVVGLFAKSNSAVLKDIVSRGHAIGIHTYSHNYQNIYKNTDNFISEISTTENILKVYLGKDFHTRLFRFPGGSFEVYKKQYKDILKRNGYVSVDWNVITGDGESSDLSPQQLFDRLKTTSKSKHQLIILMHDSSSKQTTVDVLPDIIEYLISQEYEFAVLN